MKRHHATLLLACGLALAAAQPAGATTFTWLNPGTSGSANDPGSWDQGSVPSFADGVVLPASATPYTVAVNAANSSNNFQLNEGLTIGANATWEEIDGTGTGGGPSTELVGAPLVMQAGATLIRRNGGGSTTQWWCNAGAGSSLDPDSEYVFARNIIGFAVPPYSVGTIVIDNPGSPNPDYPLGSFTITGDFIVRNGSFAAAWGGVSPTNMTCRNFIVEGATSEVRLRNGNIDGTLTIQGDLVVRDGGVFRDAAGGLVVSQAVPVNIGGDLIVETGGSLANLGGVFDWVTTFNGSGGQLMSNNGGAGCAAETVVVAGGTTLEMADGPMSMASLTASTLTVNAFSGGLLDGAYAHNESASFAGNGTATISDATVTLSTALNTDVGGLIVDSSVDDWLVIE